MKRKQLIAALALAFATASAGAQSGAPADVERESLEQLRETTIALIEQLVEQGVLTRDKADALLKNARQRAAERRPGPVVAAPPSNVVRVPYIPESVRAEISEELRQDVLRQARAERWGDPGALPSWLDRITVDGDLRFRFQHDRLADSNPAAAQFAEAAEDNGLTRAPALTTRSSNGIASANTTEDRDRLRVRGRLGVLAKVDPAWGAGFRIATGTPASGVVNTNATLGQNGTNYSVVVDRAFIRYEPSDWFTGSVGRIPQPFFGTNLVWNDDLNVDGIALTGRWGSAQVVQPFLTAGYFVLRESQLPARGQREWTGAQLGVNAKLSPEWKLRTALGVYDFPNIEGRLEQDFAESTTLGYGRYEYPAALRQQGNTLFRTNSLTDQSTANLWGLASEFSLQTLTAALDWSRFDPVMVVLSADYVRNSAFDRGEIFERTGVRLPDGEDTGYQLRATVGMPSMRLSRDWQIAFGYRKLGSDATLDAFNDSDFGLGGTNSKGWFLTGQYGLGRSAWVSLRYLSSSTVDSPTLRLLPTGDLARDTLKVDVLQVDLNVRF